MVFAQVAHRRVSAGSSFSDGQEEAEGAQRGAIGLERARRLGRQLGLEQRQGGVNGHAPLASGDGGEDRHFVAVLGHGVQGGPAAIEEDVAHGVGGQAQPGVTPASVSPGSSASGTACPCRRSGR